LTKGQEEKWHGQGDREELLFKVDLWKLKERITMRTGESSYSEKERNGKPSPGIGERVAEKKKKHL